MQPMPGSRTRPEAMGDVPGICEIPLTRAVVQYRDGHEMDAPGGRIEDVGLALVIEGRYAAAAEAIDLGSGSLKVLDLSTELVGGTAGLAQQLFATRRTIGHGVTSAMRWDSTIS